MPILDVEIVGSESGMPGLARRIADNASRALGSEPGRTWVKIRYVPPHLYAEDGPTGAHPVFVRVLTGRTEPSGGRVAAARALTEAVAAASGWPSENVHVLFEPSAIGRVAFGGQLVE